MGLAWLTVQHRDIQQLRRQNSSKSPITAQGFSTAFHLDQWVYLHSLAKMHHYNGVGSMRDDQIRVLMNIHQKFYVNLIIRTHVNWSKLACSSSWRKARSSDTSWSVHFRPERALMNWRSFATTMAGRFSSGAFLTRFFHLVWLVSDYPEYSNDQTIDLFLDCCLWNVD